jgi:hypothetical protein
MLQVVMKSRYSSGFRRVPPLVAHEVDTARDKTVATIKLIFISQPLIKIARASNTLKIARCFEQSNMLNIASFKRISSTVKIDNY